MLNNPRDIKTDTHGNIFIADAVNHRVRKIDVLGNISTIAGNGVGGYSGDNGPATAASITGVTFLNTDPHGNLILADQIDHRIRKIDASGLITTIVGNGSPNFYGDGGPATNAQVSLPAGVVLDVNGNLYFSDFNNKRIRMVFKAVNGINVSDGSSVISIYPNPSSGNFIISSPLLANENAKVLIIDITGKVVQRCDTRGNSTIQLAIGEAGVYTLTIILHDVATSSIISIK